MTYFGKKDMRTQQYLKYDLFLAISGDIDDLMKYSRIYEDPLSSE